MASKGWLEMRIGPLVNLLIEALLSFANIINN